ncbi:hypothetical protein [Azospirillum ramasamyi]|uniref:Uncharacterized protein n=1 Tax=Azospirillum ramasamyi TaxID=682998 RepID=A0A2U9SAP1_9PROT|nr:hypothetical protein [Azospirillum ramasamyi]AWU95646.1 hypothetical protein DM194_15220 [Azospirillum ramasamyi]
MGKVIEFASRLRPVAAAAPPSKTSPYVDVVGLLRRLEEGELQCVATRSWPGRGHEVDLELWGTTQLTFTSNALRMTPAKIGAVLQGTAVQLRQQAEEGGVLRESLLRQRWLEASQELMARMKPYCGTAALGAALRDASEALLALQAAPRIWAAAWDTAEGRQRVGW